jgi:hypothetical protein
MTLTFVSAGSFQPLMTFFRCGRQPSGVHLESERAFSDLVQLELLKFQTRFSGLVENYLLEIFEQLTIYDESENDGKED